MAQQQVRQIVQESINSQTPGVFSQLEDKLRSITYSKVTPKLRSPNESYNYFMPEESINSSTINYNNNNSLINHKNDIDISKFNDNTFFHDQNSTFSQLKPTFQIKNLSNRYSPNPINFKQSVLQRKLEERVPNFQSSLSPKIEKQIQVFLKQDSSGLSNGEEQPFQLIAVEDIDRIIEKFNKQSKTPKPASNNKHTPLAQNRIKQLGSFNNPRPLSVLNKSQDNSDEENFHVLINKQYSNIRMENLSQFTNLNEQSLYNLNQRVESATPTIINQMIINQSFLNQFRSRARFPKEGQSSNNSIRNIILKNVPNFQNSPEEFQNSFSYFNYRKSIDTEYSVGENNCILNIRRMNYNHSQKNSVDNEKSQIIRGATLQNKPVKAIDKEDINIPNESSLLQQNLKFTQYKDEFFIQEKSKSKQHQNPASDDSYAIDNFNSINRSETPFNSNKSSINYKRNGSPQKFQIQSPNKFKNSIETNRLNNNNIQQINNNNSNINYNTNNKLQTNFGIFPYQPQNFQNSQGNPLDNDKIESWGDSDNQKAQHLSEFFEMELI